MFTAFEFPLPRQEPRIPVPQVIIDNDSQSNTNPNQSTTGDVSEIGQIPLRNTGNQEKSPVDDVELWEA